ncbi:DUF2497 domain-containing protein [Microvirga sp. c23x22]|uniref:DUF2497 domain-containing protein n=2 Tax=Microvirga terricola TaxID=2719797 RepID=A0ABX0VD21_9HYPH|nr:DUF2497 domain-containing protein [Microvirga terricola]
MEEILASIRRIIADDQDEMQEAEKPESQTASSPLKNVLDIAESYADVLHQTSPKIAPEFDRSDDSAGRKIVDKPAPKREQVYKIERLSPSSEAFTEPAAFIDDDALMSDDSDAFVADAFDRLSSTVPASSPKTLEDLAKELLRPMLKAWLDDNLPPLVERLVQAEIERVSRRGR